MIKKIDKTILITTLICFWPILLGYYFYADLPAQIAVHFNSSGNPDRFFAKDMAVFGLPIIMAVINLYAHFRVNSDPQKTNVSAILKIVYKWAVPVLTTILMPITFFKAMGMQIPITVVGSLMTGLLIILCGNYLPKCRKNYTIGIRLPWTLDNDENWYKTHRFAGVVWVIGGFAFAANVFFSSIYVMIAVIVLLIGLPALYSYLLYRKQTAMQIA